MISDEKIKSKDFDLYDILDIKKKWITKNKYSRPNIKLNKIKAVVLHWVANPRTTPEQNIRFFEDRKNGKTGYGSAHYFVGIDGAKFICIPEDEMAYHVGAKKYKEDARDALSHYPNNCTIGVELCHLDWEGNFSNDTIFSASFLVGWLCYKYDLDPITDVWRHYDIVANSKLCPKLFVEQPQEFEDFKKVVVQRVKAIKHCYDKE